MEVNLTKDKQRALQGLSKFLKRVTGNLSARGCREAWLWGRRSAWYLPCRPWALRYQLLPSHQASPADLGGPEPQGGQLGQMHPAGRKGVHVGRYVRRLQTFLSSSCHRLPLPRPPSCLPLLRSSSPLGPCASPSSLSRASWASSGVPAGGTSLTYFGTVSARSAREAAGALEALGAWRPTFAWEASFTLWQTHQGEIRQRQGGEVGKQWDPRPQTGHAGRHRERDSSVETTGNGQQDTHPGAHEAGGASFTRNALENKRHVREWRL